MSRIRSIHPGLFTDEAFVVLSPMARVFFMGLWTECDDWGSFEWSPLKLKMRLLPADNVDASALLAEIEQARGIMRYEVDGRSYGAVRNFCQYQRPKKPNQSYPQPEAVREWVNTEARSTRDGSEPVGKQLPTGGEKSRQMKDGGWSSSSEAKASGDETPPADPEKVMFDAGVKLLTASGKSDPASRALLGKWRKAQGSAAVIEALGAAQREGAIDPAAYIEGRWRAKRAQPQPAVPL